jgi:hypothetical protein
MKPFWEVAMSFRRWILPVTLLLAAACSDGIAPPAPTAAGPHLLRWAGPSAPRFSAVGAVARPGISAVAPVIDAYQASFWAVRGESRTLRLNYQSADGSYPFLEFTATDPTWVPDRGELAVGDSVLITVRVDSEVVRVVFEPSGLQFGTPSGLTIWYSGVVGDLNADGVVDTTDAYIEDQLLGLWYRDNDASPWSPITATKSLEEKRFSTEVPHFTEYAVSW